MSSPSPADEDRLTALTTALRLAQDQIAELQADSATSRVTNAQVSPNEERVHPRSCTLEKQLGVLREKEAAVDAAQTAIDRKMDGMATNSRRCRLSSTIPSTSSTPSGPSAITRSGRRIPSRVYVCLDVLEREIAGLKQGQPISPDANNLSLVEQLQRENAALKSRNWELETYIAHVSHWHYYHNQLQQGQVQQFEPPLQAVTAPNGSGENNNAAPCTECGINQTPRWRRSATGKRLCNACGLRARNNVWSDKPDDEQDRDSSLQADAPPTQKEDEDEPPLKKQKQSPILDHEADGGSAQVNASSPSISVAVTNSPSAAALHPLPLPIAPIPLCTQCGTCQTSHWRRSLTGMRLCNPCGLAARR
ncbi:hypothetical protein C8F01DRAFT_1187349 [Mycena amicta]|nr:hypothetical protein C8F01DRAFT_1187349 [Mycena amicta]